MNHAIFLVKIIKGPVHLTYNSHETIELETQFAGINYKSLKNKLLLTLWGDHRDDFLKYYKVHDYLVIEGILTNKGYDNNKSNFNLKIIAKRVYPFFLS